MTIATKKYFTGGAFERRRYAPWAHTPCATKGKIKEKKEENKRERERERRRGESRTEKREEKECAREVPGDGKSSRKGKENCGYERNHNGDTIGWFSILFDSIEIEIFFLIFDLGF